jgi:hypothetical protein
MKARPNLSCGTVFTPASFMFLGSLDKKRLADNDVAVPEEHPDSF